MVSLVLSLPYKGYIIKVILSRLISKIVNMNWIQKFAQWILSEELEKQNKEHECKVSGLESEKEALEKMNENLRKLAFGNRKILMSQTMLKCITQMLPDPNKVGTGGITASELKLRNMGFVDELRGQKYQHSVRFVKAIGGEDENIQGLTIHISDYNLNVFIPLRRENVSYEVYGVSSAIDTYFWDFYGAGIRMVSDEAWAMSIEFITAQNNVMKELREEGLL